MVALLEIRVCVGYFRSNETPLVDGMMSFTNAGNRTLRRPRATGTEEAKCHQRRCGNWRKVPTR